MSLWDVVSSEKSFLNKEIKKRKWENSLQSIINYNVVFQKVCDVIIIREFIFFIYFFSKKVNV